MGDHQATKLYDEQKEEQILVFQRQCLSAAKWTIKERAVQQLAQLIKEHPTEFQEALLLAGPAAFVDSMLSTIASERTQFCNKLLAADMLSDVCSTCIKACLLLSPSHIVETLMRCAYQRHGDTKTAAARALWRLSCHNDFSPEVVSHAGSAFKVVELLAEDMQQGSSSTCVCALRATQNLLHVYAANGASDAGERIGGRVIEPLCNLLEASHPEAAAAAADLLALLGQSPSNRARIVAAGGVQRLVMLMRQASSNCSSSAVDCMSAADLQQENISIQQQEAAAAQALHALTELSKGDSKLCLELLGAHIMPGLLQLLRHKVCCPGVLALMGDLVTLPEGRRALQYAEGFAALAESAEACPKPAMCRLLFNATKGCSLLSDELVSLAGSPALLMVLTHCCGHQEKKIRKRAMQVLGRLLSHSRANGKSHQLQSQLLALGLLQQLEGTLQLALNQRPAAAANGGASVMEIQLTVGLLLELVTTREVLVASAGTTEGAAKDSPCFGTSGHQKTACSQEMPASLKPTAAELSGRSSEQMTSKFVPATSTMQAILNNPALVWKHPAAAAAAFGDMRLLLTDGTTCDAGGEQQQAVPLQAFSTSVAARGCRLSPSLLQISWLLLQLLLSPNHQLPSLQQQVLQVMAELAAHRHEQLLHMMIQQGWVQLLWSFLPGGRQLLAVTVSHLIHQQHKQRAGTAAEPASTDCQNVPSNTSTLRTGGYSAGLAQGAPDIGAKNGSNLHPHLLQLLDDSLPSVQQTTYALEALAHLCSSPAAACIAVQLQVAYQAAATAGMLTVRSSAHSVPQPGTAAVDGAAETAGVGPAVAVVALLFGGTASPRAIPGKGGTTANRQHSQPASPRNLPSTPPSFSSSASSGSSGHSTFGSYAMVPGQPALSSSLPSSTLACTVPGSCSDGGSGATADSSGNAELRRSSSSGFLSRFGLGRKDSISSNQQKMQPAVSSSMAADGASGVADASRATISNKGQPTAATDSAGAQSSLRKALLSSASSADEPVEDPGSPIEMLVTLLGEQWAATASAELLAHIAAAGPNICVPVMIDQGVIGTLAACMKEIQDNPAGAVAAMAMLLLVKQLGSHCPELLFASGILALVLQMLVQGCGGQKAVQQAALDVVVVLCQAGDRQLCAAVAQAALVPLVRWLSNGQEQLAAAARVLTLLLDQGVVDGTVITSLQDSGQSSELLELCMDFLSTISISSDSNKHTGTVGDPHPAVCFAEQHVVQLPAIRLVRALVELDAKLVDAFLAIGGLNKLLTLLSAAVAAVGSNQQPALAAVPGSDKAPAGSISEQHSRLVLQHECLAVLDSLSLVHRRVLVEAAIIPIIVGVLRQQPVGPTGAAKTRIPVESLSRDAAAGSDGVGTGTPNTVRSASSGVTRTNSAKTLARSSSKARRAAAALSALNRSPPELLLACKVIACNLITVLAINNEVKRQLFHSDAVGPLMQLADGVEEGSRAQEAIRAALAQLGLVYLLPAGPV